jgi:hypothetical protein
VDDADVDAPLAQRLGLRQRVELEQAERHLGDVLPEEGQHVGEDARVGGRLDEPHAQPPHLAQGGALRGPQRAVGLGEHLADLAEEGAPGGGELDAARAAHEQLGAHLLLEVADLPAERRLGDVQPRGRPPEVQLLGDGHEVAEVAELHAGPASGRGHADAGPITPGP